MKTEKESMRTTLDSILAKVAMMIIMIMMVMMVVMIMMMMVMLVSLMGLMVWRRLDTSMVMMVNI